MRAWFLATGALMIAVAGGAACARGNTGIGGEGGGDGGAGGTPVLTTTTGSGNGPSTSSSGGPSVSSSSSASSASSSSGSNNPCSSLPDCSQCPTSSTCSICCDDHDPTASLALVTYLIDYCVCQPGSSPCYAVCAMNGQPSDACSDPNAGVTQACVDCVNALTSNDQCINDTVNACYSDFSCAPIIDCYGLCP